MATSTVFATNMTAVKKTIILEAIYVRSVEYRFILVQLCSIFGQKSISFGVKKDSSVLGFQPSLLQLYKCKY